MSKEKKTTQIVASEEAYNPLDKRHLGESVAAELMHRPIQKLPPAPFLGAGVYAIYYVGPFPVYARLVAANKAKGPHWPVYVGKAIPTGGRKGGAIDAPQTNVLYNRLKEHAQSIQQASNLDLADFSCRYLVVDDIWIPLGESLMISKFAPVWNKVVDGFGNHAPGGGRSGQKQSPWDILHPGRSWATRLPKHTKSPQSISQEIDAHITHFLASIPKDER